MYLKDIDLRELYRKWKKNLKQFRGFYRSTPFVTLQDYDDFKLKCCEQGKYDELAENILLQINEGTLCIVDLPFDVIIDIALVFNNKYRIKPVLNINMFFNEHGIIGTEDNISKLINNSLMLEDINTDKFIMLYDYDRYDDSIDLKKIYDKLNNQYGIGDDDFPHASFLKSFGYGKVMVFTKKRLKEDMKIQLDYLQKEIEVKIEEVECFE
ncbi:hypothetical protein [Clostridium butyricum]|uniref:hypothetical protein n=1 Tax=Clostridium butyricum TaxID=1492 RepID=UPI0004005E23|nr:hypothetical protein [Clostridium butyricum]